MRRYSERKAFLAAIISQRIDRVIYIGPRAAIATLRRARGRKIPETTSSSRLETHGADPLGLRAENAAETRGRTDRTVPRRTVA